MTPLKTETLELTLDENNVAHMRVSGRMSADTITEGLSWFETASEANDNLNLCVEMEKGDFENLTAVSDMFRKVGDVLRRTPALDKCAVVTDSQFVRNSAKIEGAVIPNVDVKAFAPEDMAPAESWLNGESVIEAAQDTAQDTAQDAAADTVVITQSSPQKAQAVPPTAPAPESANPWDNFTVKDLDI